MNYFYILTFTITSLCCSDVESKKTIRKEGTTLLVAPLCNLPEAACDSIAQLFVKQFKRESRNIYSNERDKSEINFSFESGYSDVSSYKKYMFFYKGSSIALIDTSYNIGTSKSITQVNGLDLNICNINNKDFVIDSMEMSIDYSNSDVYVFNHDTSYLLVVSKSDNWVGNMTRFSFFQLINVKENLVIQFITDDFTR
jgi:hypothetical protein